MFTNVERPRSKNSVQRAISQVKAALDEEESVIHVFDSMMTNYKVYENTLWQSMPVHRVHGQGIRGREMARKDLGAIASELFELIEKIDEGNDD